MALKKRYIITLSGEALEKTARLPAGRISQYARDAIIEKIQRDAASYTGRYNDDLIKHLARIADALENITAVMSNISVNSGNILLQTISNPQTTEPIAEPIIDTDDELKRLKDIEDERLIDEMIINSALDILNNGWGNTSNGEK